MPISEKFGNCIIFLLIIRLEVGDLMLILLRITQTLESRIKITACLKNS